MKASLDDQNKSWCRSKICGCDDAMREVLGKAQNAMTNVSSYLRTVNPSGMGGAGNNDSASSEDVSDCSQFHPLEFTKGSENCKLWFSTISGLDEPKREFRNAFMNPLLMPRMYGKISKGILNFGPPGTGKTLLVKAAVNELQRDKNVRVVFHAPTAAELKGKQIVFLSWTRWKVFFFFFFV